MAMGYDLCETDSESPVSICIFCQMCCANTCFTWANYELNVSNNWFSDILTSPGRTGKGGVKVSG